jgi:hypothetical protein
MSLLVAHQTHNPRRFVRWASACVLWCVCVTPTWGQAPAAPGGRVVGGGKSFVIEGVVTVLLCGVAIFAVGRTGRRN